MKLIPPRFLAGSTEPATAYTVGELREMLAELPRHLTLYTSAWTRGVMLVVRSASEDTMLEITAVPDDLDALAEYREIGGES